MHLMQDPGEAPHVRRRIDFAGPSPDHSSGKPWGVLW